MELRKFYGALDAAEYAARLAEEWTSGDGEPWDAETLKGVFGISDEENPLDEEDENVYFVVDVNGAVGLTENGGATVEWMAVPTRRRKPAARFCANCGARLTEGAAFCENCGRRV